MEKELAFLKRQKVEKELKPVGRPPKVGNSMTFKLKTEVVEIINQQKNKTVFVENAVLFYNQSEKLWKV